MGQFTHEGVIYEELGNGQVRVIGYADAPTAADPYTVGTPDPGAAYEAPQAAATLARTRQEFAQEAATAPFDAQKAAADARKALADAARAERELNAPAGPEAETRDRLSRLNQLTQQINRVQQLYDTSIGTTKGLAGIQDYLPTDANARFDAAGAALSQQGLAAFRVPGTGTVSDRDAIMFDRANLPTAATRDAAIEEQLLGLKSRVTEEMKALGQPAPFADQTTQRTVAPGMGQMQLTSGPVRTEADPARAGVAARVNRMLKSGASDAEVTRYAAGVGADPASISAVLQFRRANPNYRGDYNTSDLELRDVPMTAARQILNRAAQSPAGAYAINAADALTLGGMDEFSSNPDLTRAQMEGVAAANPIASTLGTISGGAMAAGGLEGLAVRGGLTGARAAVAGDALFGAGYGAGSADPNNRLSGALLGAGAGVGGGMFGRGLTRTGGRALRGVQNTAVDTLRSRGVPLTLGQAVGGSGRIGAMVKGVEDRLTGLPFVGDVVNARRREGFEGFNRAAFDEAMAPIGQNSAGAIGETGVEAAQDAVGQAYDDALNGVRVQADAPFIGAMRQTIADGAALPDPMATRAGYTLNTRVGNSFGPAGELDGRGFQQSIRGLQRDARAVANEPYGYDFGQVTDAAQGNLRGLLQRQSPDTLPAYDSANAAFRRTEVLREAVNRSRNGTRTGETGVFAPSQLADAAAQNARRFGNSQGTTRQPFFDLSRAGQEVLPGTVPDSGTAGRLATIALPGALAGGGAGVGAVGGDTQTGAGVGLATALALMAGGSRGGQRALVAAATRRPEAARRAGDALLRRARVGGMFGAPVGYQMLAPVLLQDGY